MKIFIGGNTYGYGNIGDDAVLCGIVASMDAIEPNTELCIESQQGGTLDFIKRPHQGVCAGDWTAFETALKWCDVFVVGGGTTIGDELSIKFPLIHVAQRVASAVLFSKKVVFWGNGANQLSGAKATRIASGLVNAASLICCRDSSSAEVCESLAEQMQKDKIRYYADPAYLVTPQVTDRTVIIRRRLANYDRAYGVNIVNEVWAAKSGYKRAVAEACNRVYAETGAVPIFFENEIRPGGYFDLMANLETTKWLDCPLEILYPEYYTPQEMMEIVSGFSAVFSMRMHPLIFASCVGVPFDGISRVDKTDNFFEQFGRQSCCQINNVSVDAVYNSIMRMLEAPQTVLPQIAILREAALDCAKDFFNRIEAAPSCQRCPLEILRYAPCGSKMRKLFCYLSYGIDGIKEMVGGN